LAWIGFNKILLNKLTATKIQAADSGNSVLSPQTKGTNQEQD
jgi:hypothetical protein